MYGLSDDEITAIREGSFDGFEPAEAALLRHGRRHGRHPVERMRRALCRIAAYFSEEQLIELAASAAQENFRARYNRVFDVGSDGLYRPGLRFKERRVA